MTPADRRDFPRMEARGVFDHEAQLDKVDGLNSICIPDGERP